MTHVIPKQYDTSCETNKNYFVYTMKVNGVQSVLFRTQLYGNLLMPLNKTGKLQGNCKFFPSQLLTFFLQLHVYILQF